MKAQSKARERVFTVFFMFAVTLVSISAVSAVYVSTADIVARNGSLFAMKAVLEAAGRPVPKAAADIVRSYEASVAALAAGSNRVCYAILDPASRATNGYVFIESGAGLWGQITAAVGLNADLSEMTGITFTRQNETPGLGARIEERWFRRQFVGKRGPFRLVPEGTHSTSAREFDAITGATITSSAVRDIVNKAIGEARKRAAGGAR